VRPVIWPVVSVAICVEVSALSSVVVIAANCVEVRPCTCVLVSAATCVVVKLPRSVVVSEVICAELKPPSCVVVRASSCVVENPAISYLRLVECYAAGPEAIRRGEEITRSFTIFLEEGYRYRPQAQEVPRLSSQAIAGAVFEVVRRHIARDDYASLQQHLPQLTYIAIAPFTGPRDAVGLVEKLSAREPFGRA